MVQTVSFRGSKSRNKVSVGEPSEGSYSRGKECRLMEASICAATINQVVGTCNSKQAS